MFPRANLLIGGIAITLALASTGRCAVVLQNYPGNDSGAFAGFDSTVGYSIGFTVGTTPFSISSVEFHLKANVSAGNATLELRNDNAGNPTSTGFLTFSTQNVASGSFAEYSFTPLASQELLANTTYWLTLGTDMSAIPNNNGLVVAANNPSLVPTGSLATFAGLRSGFINDQTFDVIGFAPIPSFQINGVTAVPEPASVGAIGLFTAFYVWRRKRRGSAAISSELCRVRRRRPCGSGYDRCT